MTVSSPAPYDHGMKGPLAVILFAAASVVIFKPVLAEERDWTRAADGKKIRAEFVGMKDETTVKIKMSNGRTFEVPLTSLSEADATYIKELAPKMAAAEPAKPPALPEGETSLTLSGVHLCCAACEDGVTEIGNDPKNPLPAGVTLTPDRKAGSILIKAPSGKDAQAALRSIVAAGFYGSSDNDALKITDLKPDDFTAETMTVTNIHLCCGSCVKAFNKAVESVEGVKASEAKSGAERVVITGTSFKPYEVMQALRAAGFGGSFR